MSIARQFRWLPAAIQLDGCVAVDAASLPEYCGIHSDIFRGSFRNTAVAVKRPRLHTAETSEERLLLTEVRALTMIHHVYVETPPPHRIFYLGKL